MRPRPVVCGVPLDLGVASLLLVPFTRHFFSTAIPRRDFSIFKCLTPRFCFGGGKSNLAFGIIEQRLADLPATVKYVSSSHLPS